MAKVEYRGGIPELRKTGTTSIAAFMNHVEIVGIGFTVKNYKIPYSCVTDVTLVAEGVKKQNYVLNIEYELDGFSTTAIFTGKETSKVYGSIQKYRKNFKPKQVESVSETPAPEEVSQIDVTEELAKYFDLKEKGIITEEEFATKKAQLLNL